MMPVVRLAIFNISFALGGPLGNMFYGIWEAIEHKLSTAEIRNHWSIKYVSYGIEYTTDLGRMGRNPSE